MDLLLDTHFNADTVEYCKVGSAEDSYFCIGTYNLIEPHGEFISDSKPRRAGQLRLYHVSSQNGAQESFQVYVLLF